ncbi:MAG TPA: hypothetical protein VGF95_04705 [Solirubrobacteraceae bacterium]|jgi:hypothetical protein
MHAARLPRPIIAAAAAAALVLPATVAPGAASAGEASWRLEEPAPPAGSRFKVPLGTPDDLEFYAPNEGLLSVEGNAVVSAGLYFWNGHDWHQLSTVCGGSGGASRIAWEGPDAFWVITEPSEPRAGSGLGLCHFVDGEVVGSYSTAYQSPEPFRPMDAAACSGPDDCWFAGIGSESPNGDEIGAYHLHWNGLTLAGSYQPQGRGVSALAYFDGTFYESTFVGTQEGDRTDPVTLANPEPNGPILIHKLVGETFLDTGFRPYEEGASSEGAELLSAKADQTNLWFAGGGAASGPGAPSEGVAKSPPIAVRYDEPFFIQTALDESLFGDEDRFVDISPIPSTSDAWVADQPYAQRGSTTSKAKVALLAPGAEDKLYSLPTTGAGRGSAQLVAATGPEEAWMVTSAGWIFHYTDGTVLPEDDDAYWSGTITQRPNESVAQFVSDTPPPDDSQLFAPPPVQTEVEGEATTKTRYVIPALLKHIKVARDGLTVIVSFHLDRKALVRLIAKRHGRLVAETAKRRLGPGIHRLSLKLTRQRWPTALRFVTKELTKPKPVPVRENGPSAVSTSVRRKGER